ncbi:MAG: hypothetical protein ABSE39_07535 [Candidatus Bathyarchaeia archaeon]|jgi:hypothetical protein
MIWLTEITQTLEFEKSCIQLGQRMTSGFIGKLGFRYQWYNRLLGSRPAIHEEAKRAAREMGLDKFNGQLGLSTTSSSCPAPLAKYVWDALAEARKKRVLPIRIVENELRDIVKEAFGDDYDGVVTNTCESALRIAFETLVAPPIMARGSTYRARFIAPYGHDDEFMAGYGRPFPPKYKNLWSDRSVSAGETGVEAKTLANLDAIIVKLIGARYEVHGINFNTCALLADVNPEKSAARIEEVALRHIDNLAGFETIGHDIPGFGYGAKDEKGVPRLQRQIGKLAEKYDVPYILDAAVGVPIIGTHPRDVNATVMMWSFDKAVHAITSGLMVGREEDMGPIRKALGLHGERTGTLSSHGKAAFSFADPGRDAVISQIAVLRTLTSQPKLITDPIDRMYSITQEEFSRLEPSWLREVLLITKSYHCGSVEIDYEHTWQKDKFGIPIFSGEDMFTNTDLIMSSLGEMGVYPPPIYDGTILITPGMGDTDEDGNFIEENMRLSIRALARSIEIVCKYAGLT